MKKTTAHIILLSLLLVALPVSLKAQNPFEVKPVPVISSNSDDIVSVVVKDEITSAQTGKLIRLLPGKILMVKNYDLYYSSFGQGNEPGRPDLYSSELRGKYNIGPACISPDGKTLYFTRNYLPGKSKKIKGESDKYGIFIAHKNGKNWGNIEAFEFNDLKYRLAYPSVSQDGRYLYFSSDMEGTLGKSDIFVSENVNGKWTKPVNLGLSVNSSASEIYPFIHNSGRLYFSSDRQGGKGGLDIYYSVFSDGQWSKPFPMSEPVNSESDDFAFYWHPLIRAGIFLQTARKGDDDIIAFINNNKMDSCDQLQPNSYCYEFIEETALKNDSAEMEFKWEWDFDDGNKAEGITAVHCFEGPGSYYIQLNFVNKITGTVEKNQASYTLDITNVEQPFITAPDTISTGELAKFDASQSYLPGWQIANYYWNFDDETTGTGIDIMKKFARKGKFNIQLIISAVPDANGVIREACVCKNIIVTERNK